ncbi:tryptophan synthase subunit alpha [Aceticella autotrophica]|uniref:Tryptophan synthase alpha chain n=1 Tax=Aceticella autotrophica TaxID=2755338 RepID=A0A975AXB5_9THEO|nr:tryptophan synthase subunit alpha [Aceticella autotrophica]QSZ28220.1 tryptophan synthase subunit alpha [Aceticella autotrophica]
MNRIDLRFKILREEGRKAMIPFIVAGDPEIETTIELVEAMDEAGADIIELGIPYSDPLADGPIIQASSTKALLNGVKIPDIMEAVHKIREKSDVPLIYLVYYNSVFRYGIERFMQEAKKAGIDGLIIPDLPLEEREELMKIAGNYEVYLIPLVAPTSQERIKKICENGKGFVYCVSTTGVTGVRQDIETNIKDYMDIISKYTDMPKALGFGISDSEMAKKFKPYCDGIIVGSAIVKKIDEGKNKTEIIDNVKKFVKEIKDVL